MTERPQRVLVYGVTGSGKTTLARKIAHRLDFPLVVVDDLTWLPGWVPVEKQEQLRRIREVAASPAWVVDHCYGSMIDILVPRADLVVALDYPRWLSFSRLLRRTVVSVATRRQQCNGNVETWRTATARDSILVWHVKSFARKRERMRAWDAAGELPVIRFASPRQARRWLESL